MNATDCYLLLLELIVELEEREVDLSVLNRSPSTTWNASDSVRR